jgi:hypothetical protein
MKRTLTLLFWIFTLALEAQTLDKFYSTYGGSGDDIGYDCKQSLDGHYIITGSSSSAGNGQTDLLLMKVSSAGQLLWQKFIGGSGNEIGKSVILLNDSGFIITGFTSSFGNGGYDMYVVRTDKSGNLIWQKGFGGNDWDFGNSATACLDGNFIAVGSSYGNAKQDGFAVKFDSNGNSIWQKFYGGSENDEFNKIFTHNGNEFFLAGKTESFGDSNGDMYCVKINTNGDTLFSLKHGSSGIDKANDVIATSSNEVILAGAITSSLGQMTDMAVVKFNASQNFVWEKSYSLSNENEECFGIIASASPILANFVAIYTTHEIAGYHKDFKTIYMDSNGDYFGGWYSGSFGFPQDDEIVSIAQTSDKGYISCGYSNSFTTGNKDVLLVKRDSVLNPGLSIVGVVEEQTNQNMFAIYPNPVRQEDAWINFHADAKQMSVIRAKATDVLGRETELSINTLEQKISIQSLSKGYHVLTISGSNFESRYHLIVN